jgi:hypothetical protein
MHAYEMHAHKMHAHETHAHEMHAYEGFYEDLARQSTVARLFQLQLGFRRRHTWVSVSSHMGFSHRCGDAARSAQVPALIDLVSTCLSVFNLSVYHFSVDPIGWPIRLPALLFSASPTALDSLDSELWYRFGCRAAALASAAPRPLGSLFGSFSPRGAHSKGDQQPDGRVAHNQKL